METTTSAGDAVELYQLQGVGLPEDVVAQLRHAPFRPGLEAIALLVRHCHERWDGRGYPDGLAGEQIPLASRIVALAGAVASRASIGLGPADGAFDPFLVARVEPAAFAGSRAAA